MCCRKATRLRCRRAGPGRRLEEAGDARHRSAQALLTTAISLSSPSCEMLTAITAATKREERPCLVTARGGRGRASCVSRCCNGQEEAERGAGGGGRPSHGFGPQPLRSYRFSWFHAGARRIGPCSRVAAVVSPHVDACRAAWQSGDNVQGLARCEHFSSHGNSSSQEKVHLVFEPLLAAVRTVVRGAQWDPPPGVLRPRSTDTGPRALGRRTDYASANL